MMTMTDEELIGLAPLSEANRDRETQLEMIKSMQK